VDPNAPIFDPFADSDLEEDQKRQKLMQKTAPSDDLGSNRSRSRGREKTEVKDKDQMMMETMSEIQKNNQALAESMQMMMRFMAGLQAGSASSSSTAALGTMAIPPALVEIASALPEIATATRQVAERVGGHLSAAEQQRCKMEELKMMQAEKISDAEKAEIVKFFKKVKDRLEKQLNLKERIAKDEKLLEEMGVRAGTDSDSSEGVISTVCESLVSARNSAKLPNLTGAATIIYGLPVVITWDKKR
jgi:hypothetical protein